ncbi:hypothetical protein PROFUN_03167 [Planoprotostelium fungivorum]|uniref:Uncharacterized protein n=1 Tax=Planoprotostelium fungivorum TaxID=1890364 RepID=A0A2P6NWW5_9EUKA|nr:hypothetical protein PROFUN_03167 [Planoprotostelium fungivorum]
MKGEDSSELRATETSLHIEDDKTQHHCPCAFGEIKRSLRSFVSSHLLFEFGGKLVYCRHRRETNSSHTNTDTKPINKMEANTAVTNNIAVTEAVATQGLTEAPVKTLTQEKPVVVQETIHPVEKVQVQPIIYREREQLEVHQITQKLHQTHIMSPIVERQILEPQYRNTSADQVSELESIKAQLAGREDVESYEVIEEADVTRVRVIKRPIIQESRKRTIVEEVQPVIIRDTISHEKEVESLAVFEKIVMVPIRFRFRGQVDFASFSLDQPFDVPLGQVMTVEDLYRLQLSAAKGATGGFVPMSTVSSTTTTTTATNLYPQPLQSI